MPICFSTDSLLRDIVQFSAHYKRQDLRDTSFIKHHAFVPKGRETRNYAYRVVKKSWCQLARKVQPIYSQPRPAMPGWCFTKQSLFYAQRCIPEDMSKRGKNGRQNKMTELGNFIKQSRDTYRAKCSLSLIKRRIRWDKQFLKLFYALSV